MAGLFKDSLLDDGVASSSLSVTAAGCPGMDNAHSGNPWMDFLQGRLPTTRRISQSLSQSGLLSCHDPAILYRDAPAGRGSLGGGSL